MRDLVVRFVRIRALKARNSYLRFRERNSPLLQQRARKSNAAPVYGAQVPNTSSSLPLNLADTATKFVHVILQRTRCSMQYNSVGAARQHRTDGGQA